MRLIATYRGYPKSEFNIGRFYRSDMRKLNTLRLYYNFPLDSVSLFNEAMDGKETLFATLKQGKKVIGYMIYEFPYLSKDSLWLFRIPQRITEKDFVGVHKIVTDYCTNILGMEKPTSLYLFTKTIEEGKQDDQ